MCSVVMCYSYIYMIPSSNFDNAFCVVYLIMHSSSFEISFEFPLLRSCLNCVFGECFIPSCSILT